MKLSRLGVILFLFLLFASPVRADSPTVNDVAKELICLSGCNMVLSECTCCGEMGLYQEMMALIKQQINDGYSKDEIIQSFVARYGEQVLVEPPKQGFNLVAWILPFAAILGGGGIIYIAIKKWVMKGRQSQTRATVEPEEGDEEYQRRLEKELEEFTEEGFR